MLTKNYGPRPSSPVLTLALASGTLSGVERVTAVTLRGTTLELSWPHRALHLRAALLYDIDILRMALSLRSDPYISAMDDTTFNEIMELMQKY